MKKCKMAHKTSLLTFPNLEAMVFMANLNLLKLFNQWSYHDFRLVSFSFISIYYVILSFCSYELYMQ